MTTNIPSIPESVKRDDADHAMYYSQSLPYASALDQEANQWLDELCVNIAICVKARDWSPGCLFWVKRLNSYMDLKHAVPRPTRAKLAKLLFELVVMPGMDTALVEIWANACVRLIKKKMKLGPEDLVLPWSPLHLMIDRTFFPKSRQRTLISESYPSGLGGSSDGYGARSYFGMPWAFFEVFDKQIGSVFRLAEHAQRFFPASATEEILAEFLPNFSAHSVSEALTSQAYIVLLLPTQAPTHSITHAPLPSPVPALTPRDYLPTIFTLWAMLTNSYTYDSQFLDLVARVAEANVGVQGAAEGELDAGLFTTGQVRTVFSVGLRMMELPVGSKADGSSSGGAGGGMSTGYNGIGMKVDFRGGNALFLKRKQDKFKMLARFIVFTLYADTANTDKRESTLTHLANLIQATESYYHPSNYGRWSYSIVNFLRQLSWEFLKRWRDEQSPECPTPPAKRLTPTIRHEFVLILRSVTFLSLFGKDLYSVSASQATIKYLAWLEPTLIFPGLLERIYPSLETLTETHRTNSSLSALSHVAQPLVSRAHYPAGGKHILPLLQLTIPGIDLNDPIKTIASLMFITHAVMNMPIRDLTQVTSESASPDAKPSARYAGMDVDEGGAAMETDEAEEDALCQASTGEFEEWVAKFLRRVFTIFENLPNQDNKKQSANMETGLTQILLHSCEVLFFQISDELHAMALRMIVDFASTTILPNAMRAMGFLCATITSPNPSKALKQFISLCHSNISLELAHGAASSPTTSTSNIIQSDTTLHWYQSILFQVAMVAGADLLEYRAEILEITREMINKCMSRRGYTWAGKFLRYTLVSLTEVYPLECRSVDPETWKNPEFLNNHHKHWGQPGDPKNLNVQWHVPTDAELDFALELLDSFLLTSMNRLRELIAGVDVPMSTKEISNEFCRHLSVIRNCLLGTTTLVSDDGEDVKDERKSEIEGDEDSNAVHPINVLYGGYCFTDPADPRTQKARSIRYELGKFLHEIVVYFRANREDDVESLKIVIKMCKSYLTERGVEKRKYEVISRGYDYAKTLVKTAHDAKAYPRYLLVRRAYSQHLLRLKQNAYGRVRMQLHDDMLFDLAELSLSSYSEIRKLAQSALTNSVRCYIGSKPKIIPLLLDALQPGIGKYNDPERIKGALYLLNSRPLMLTCLRDWRFVPRFMLALCQAQHEDKPSVQELIRKLFVEYIFNYNNTSFRIIISKDVEKATEEVASVVISPSSDSFKHDLEEVTRKVDERRAHEMESYHKLVTSLLSLMKDPKVHWRFATMAANFLELLVRVDSPPTKDLADFSIHCTLSELPALRKIGVSSLTRMLLHVKQRTLACGDEDALLLRGTINPLKKRFTVPQPLPQGHTENFLEASWADVTEENADKVFFEDDLSVGWYVWPMIYTAYAAKNSATPVVEIDPTSQDAYEQLRQSFVSQEFWSKLSSYMSQESSKPNEDQFSTTNARFYKSIFQQYEIEPLQAVKPEIEKLCLEADQKNQQRAAAEIVGGIVRGSKHWDVRHVSELWTWLTPLLLQTFAAITPDSLTYWESFVKFCCQDRDPRRVLPLVKVIFQAEFDPTSHAAFAEARKLLFVRAILTSFTWRFLPKSRQLLETYIANIRHPYKQVREVIGGNINELLQIQWVPSQSSVKDLLRENLAKGDGVGNIPVEIDGYLNAMLDQLTHNLEVWRAEKKPASSGSTEYGNASKTILCWLHEALSTWRIVGTYPYVVSLLPELFQMQDINDDQDLQIMASRVVILVAQLSYPPAMVPLMVDKFVEMLTVSSSWHVRVKALPVLQVFFFKHLFLMETKVVMRVVEVVSGMLLDNQIEVRQLAAVTLSGLIRCSQREAITSLKEHFLELIKTKIPTRRRATASEKAVIPAGFQEAVLKRHAGALGLSCLIDAFPYEVPKWMPAVLIELAELISDPVPIQSTVKKTFSDFRRTHSDTWHEDSLEFTEDQLSLLSDMLISPSYYA